MAAEIVQIVPKLPPSISGVGDYAHLLATRLRTAHDMHTRFIVCDPSWEAANSLDGFSVDRINTRQPDELERRISEGEIPAAVLLHYVGYGYQKRGCPVWLVRGLESWKREDSSRHILVMFHELYAFGPPWRSSFWTSPLQRALVKSLALLSDHCVTNLNVSLQVLARMTARPESNFSVLPVFSNVGEPKLASNFSRRKPRMIVFGSAAWRRQAYHEHQAALEQACHALSMTEVVDIGPPCGAIPKLSVRCVPKGGLPPDQVSREMLDALAGFFSYPAACLGKSGVFAAYAAHGLVPMTYGANVADNRDGLRPNEHFLPVSASHQCDTQLIESIGRQVRRWYVRHKISKQAAHYANVIWALAQGRKGERARLLSFQNG